MTSFLKIIATTPNGDFNEYSFMGDLFSESDQNRLKDFTKFCRRDTADRFCAPDNWDVDEWVNETSVEFELMPGEEN